MERKYGEFVGVDNLHYSLITADSSASYTTGTPVYLAPVAEIAGAPEVNNLTTYYDNKAGNNFVTEGKTELKIVVSNVPAETMATILGKKYDSTSGRVYDDGQANPPYVALGFRYNMSDGYRYYWYLKGTFSGGSEDSTTKSSDLDVKTYELTFTAVTTTHEWTIDTVSKSLKRIFGDTADESFVSADWFTQVQTPDTSGAPSALSLASSVPSDGATGVSVSENLTLTFNNAIDSYAVTLINTTTPAVIPSTMGLDSTKKILTINPTSNLETSTKYAIVASKATDIYGQDLNNTVVDFETAPE